MYVCMSVCLYVCMSVCMLLYDLCMYVCTYVRMYVCMGCCGIMILRYSGICWDITGYGLYKGLGIEGTPMSPDDGRGLMPCRNVQLEHWKSRIAEDHYSMCIYHIISYPNVTCIYIYNHVPIIICTYIYNNNTYTYAYVQIVIFH